MSATRRSRLSIWWWETSYRVGPNLWVVPLLMSVGSVALFATTRWLDGTDAADSVPEALASSGAADAFVVLSALLGAVATALALVFSTTILTFSIASSQLGPRLIRRFMRDPVTQLALGSFMSTLIFLVLTLAAVRSGRRDGLPSVSVAVAVVLSLVCFGLLVLYVHRVAATIQAPNVVASVVSDLRGVLAELDSYLPTVPMVEHAEQVALAVRSVDMSGAPLLAVRTGYVELVDHPRLLDAASRADAVLVLDRRPGQFVHTGEVLAHVLPAAAAPAVRGAVDEGVEIGAARTMRQDLEFAIAQVVEIALRALSPAVNDTYTGLTCVDWLGAAVLEIGHHPERNGGLCGDDGRLRLVVPPLRFERVLKAAFDPIRQASAQNVAVLVRLLDAVVAMAPQVQHEHLRALREHADLVLEQARIGVFVSADRTDIEQRHARAVAAISVRASGPL